MRILRVILCCYCLCILTTAQAQEEYFYQGDSASAVVALKKGCSKYVKLSLRKTNRLIRQLQKFNQAYFNAFDVAQEKLLEQLCPLNERSAEYLRRDAQYSLNRYHNISTREKNNSPVGHYRTVDSLDNSIGALEKLRGDSSDCSCEGVEDLIAARQRLNSELKKAEITRGYFKERQQFLSASLKNVPGVEAHVHGLQKLEYYYNGILKEQLHVFGFKSRWESMFTVMLQQTLGLPPASLPKATEQLPNWENLKMEDLLANAPAETKETISDLKGHLDQKKENLEQATENIRQSEQDAKDASEIMPIEPDSVQTVGNKVKDQVKETKNWKPNPLKPKRFVDRLTYFGNLQMDRRNTWFPSGATVLAGIGYQVHPKSTLGVGANWLIGVEKRSTFYNEINTQRRVLTSNGLGGRAFWDFQLTRPIYVQAGYELNLRQYNSQIRMNELMAMSQWQQACLVGLKLKYPARKNQRPTFEVLYDVLHSQTGQPALVMRAGIEIKSKNSVR